MLLTKCPNCQSEVEYLLAYSLEENKQEIRLDSEGNLDWGSTETIDNSCQRIEIVCPHCNKVIYKNKGWSTDPKIKELLQENTSAAQ